MLACKKDIYNSIIFRYIATLAIIYAISIYNKNNKFEQKYLYLLLAIILTFLDFTDGIFFFQKNSKCTKTLYYQYLDKICDLISYCFVLFLFRINKLGYFIAYRLIGIIMFYITQDNSWLVVFFDFIKEYLLYIFIFGKNYLYLPFFLISKIGFEYYLHKIRNKSLT
jgi:hypothetical protein